MSYYALAATTANGSSGAFTIPFPYIDQDDVHFYLDDVELFSGVEWTGPATILITPTPAAGVVVLRRRITNLQQDPVTFQGSTIRSVDLNYLQTVLRYGIQESLDYAAYFGGGSGGGGGPSPEGALLAANNLSDVASVAASRANLLLGNAATRNVGTGAGTVAAGDDPRFSAQLGAPGLGDVNDYWLTGETTWDGATARAIAATGGAYFPAIPRKIIDANNWYRFASTISLGQGQWLRGDGAGVTKLVQNLAATPAITLGSDIFWYSMVGFTLGRAVSPTATGVGILQGQGLHDWVDNCHVENLLVLGHYRGADLGKHFSGKYQDCVFMSNTLEGVRQTTTGASTVPSGSAGGPLQAIFNNCAFATNGYDGISYNTTGSIPAGSSVGSLIDIVTYANGHHGVAYYGSASHPLHGARIAGGFIGEDVGSGVYLDTYGSKHILRAEYIELSGSYGINLSGNNTDTLVEVGHLTGAWFDGLIANTGSVDTTVNGGVYANNGRRGNGGIGLTWAGIRFAPTTTGFITGVRAKTTGGIQSFGLSLPPDNVFVAACKLDGNASAPVAYSSPATTTEVTACFPSSANTGGGSTVANLTVTGVLTVQTDLISSGTTHLNGPVAVNADVTIPTGNLYLNGTGSTQGGLVANNVAITKSLGVGTTANGALGRIDTVGVTNLGGGLAINGALTGVSTITASSNITSTGGNLVSSNGSVTATNGTVSATNLSASSSITGGTITSSVDLVANGDAHLNGSSALNGTLTVTGTGNRIFVNTGGIFAAYVTADHLGVGTPAGGSVGTVHVTGDIDKSGSVYANP